MKPIDVCAKRAKEMGLDAKILKEDRKPTILQSFFNFEGRCFQANFVDLSDHASVILIDVVFPTAHLRMKLPQILKILNTLNSNKICGFLILDTNSRHITSRIKLPLTDSLKDSIQPYFDSALGTARKAQEILEEVETEAEKENAHFVGIDYPDLGLN